MHKKQTNTVLFITGAEPCRCVYFKIQGGELYKYDSTKQGFVPLDRYNTGLPQEDSYDADEENLTTVNTFWGMEIVGNTMNGGGFSMNRSTQEMEKMEEIEISRIGQVTVQKEIQENGSNSNSMSEENDEESEIKEKKFGGKDISEDDDSINSTFPSNVYKFQDAFDNENDYMAYAS